MGAIMGTGVEGQPVPPQALREKAGHQKGGAVTTVAAAEAATGEGTRPLAVGGTCHGPIGMATGVTLLLRKRIRQDLVALLPGAITGLQVQVGLMGEGGGRREGGMDSSTIAVGQELLLGVNISSWHSSQGACCLYV